MCSGKVPRSGSEPRYCTKSLAGSSVTLNNIYQITSNVTNYINLNLGENLNLSFLVDTGADISLCKLGKLNEDFLEINEQKSCSFSGITTEKIRSIGTSELNFSIYDTKAQHFFHIVNENFPIPTDGIFYKIFM